MVTRSWIGQVSRSWRRLIIASVTVVAGLVASVPAQGQPEPPRPPGLRRPYIAVTHTLDYLQRIPGPHRVEFSNDKEYTRTTIVAINGTAATAQVALYVIGNGVVFQKETRQIPAGEEAILLPFAYFGSDPAEPPSNFDAIDPPYRGETIVVSATAPVIVTGAVKRAYAESYILFDVGVLQSASTGIRTLDVRQYNCNEPSALQAIPVFCQNYPPF